MACLRSLITLYVVILLPTSMELILTPLQIGLCAIPGYDPVVHPLYSEVFNEIGVYFEANPSALVPKNWPQLLKASDDLLRDAILPPVSLLLSISRRTAILIPFVD
jgi:hypothetical protein